MKIALFWGDIIGRGEMKPSSIMGFGFQVICDVAVSEKKIICIL
jgi:hypothetical protein